MPNKIDEIEQITSFLKIPTDDWVKLQLDIIEIIENREKALLIEHRKELNKRAEIAEDYSDFVLAGLKLCKKCKEALRKNKL